MYRIVVLYLSIIAVNVEADSASDLVKNNCLDISPDLEQVFYSMYMPDHYIEGSLTGSLLFTYLSASFIKDDQISIIDKATPYTFVSVESYHWISYVNTEIVSPELFWKRLVYLDFLIRDDDSDSLVVVDLVAMENWWADKELCRILTIK